jgi:hypothetical protein
MRVSNHTPKYQYDNITYFGTIVPNKKLSKTSQYCPDIMYNVYDDYEFQSQTGKMYGLAVLGSSDDLHVQLKKYDKKDLPINLEIANKALDHFLDKIDKCGVITPEDAFEGMQKDASIGFGAKSSGIFSRRDPKMYDYLYSYYEKSAILCHHVIISASQKDEVRPEDPNKPGQIKLARLFTAFPPEHTFLATCMLGDFFRQFYLNRFTNNQTCSAIGDALQDGAMSYYYEKLDEFPYKYATDTSAADSSISPEFINLVYDRIKLKYELSERESLLYEAVRFNSINKMLNVNGELYLCKRGLGSGDYLTTVINIMWQVYMIMYNYKHNLTTFWKDNKIVVLGDDRIMSSKYADLDMSSPYAKIEWAGKPISWEEMEFCSMKFRPYIHHDPQKVLAVLKLRKKVAYVLCPEGEMQRLGGLLRVLTNKEVYNKILNMMYDLIDRYGLYDEFKNMYISYEELFYRYNTYIDFV